MRFFTLALTLFIFFGTISGCSRPVNWPRVASCVQEPASAIVQAVYAVLSGQAEVGPALEELARKYGATTILCIVRSFAEQPAMGTNAESMVPDDVVQQRAQAFLEEIQR